MDVWSTNGDESPQPAIPSGARNLLLLFFTEKQIPCGSPGDLLGMTGLGYTRATFEGVLHGPAAHQWR
jgi:hypothetical protein